MSVRMEMAPYLSGYQEKFTSTGEIRWLPHLLFFHPKSHRSEVVNTDSVGFRYATDGDGNYAAGDLGETESVRLLAGSSTVFGIGASSDAWTLPSRLNCHDLRDGIWLNFGGRSFNSTQELLLFTLYRHLLPRVEEIVLFSGFNDLSLARMPEARDEDHGTFFQYSTYQKMLTPQTESRLRSPVRRLLRPARPIAPVVPTLEEQIALAANLTLRHLAAWVALASTWNAKVTYILQPLSGWVRDEGSAEEELIFAELERLGGFKAMYGDILSRDVNVQYAARLEQGAKDLGVKFINFSPVMVGSVQSDQWLFVDRIHLTDLGHDVVARTLLEHL